MTCAALSVLVTHTELEMFFYKLSWYLRCLHLQIVSIAGFWLSFRSFLFPSVLPECDQQILIGIGGGVSWTSIFFVVPYSGLINSAAHTMFQRASVSSLVLLCHDFMLWSWWRPDGNQGRETAHIMLSSHAMRGESAWILWDPPNGKTMVVILDTFLVFSSLLWPSFGHKNWSWYSREYIWFSHHVCMAMSNELPFQMKIYEL